MDDSRPLVTVVTPSYNQARFLPATLSSVADQDYPFIEHIVIDGGSTDGTGEILAAHPEVTSLLEPDRGQSHAINKGFKLARGGILCWLNSDDLLAPGAVTRVVEVLSENPDLRFVYGDALAIDEGGRPWGRRINVGPGDLATLLEERDFIVQPAAFWRRDLWEEVGPLREELRYVMDYELWMRFARRHRLHYLPQVLACERIHAGAKTSRGGLERIEEMIRVVTEHGGPGIPRWFRPEATAEYFWHGVRELVRGRARSACRSWRKALDLFGPPLRTLGFLLTGLLGPALLVRLRLWSNRLRAGGRDAL